MNEFYISITLNLIIIINAKGKQGFIVLELSTSLNIEFILKPLSYQFNNLLKALKKYLK